MKYTEILRKSKEELAFILSGYGVNFGEHATIYQLRSALKAMSDPSHQETSASECIQELLGTEEKTTVSEALVNTQNLGNLAPTVDEANACEKERDNDTQLNAAATAISPQENALRFSEDEEIKRLQKSMQLLTLRKQVAELQIATANVEKEATELRNGPKERFEVTKIDALVRSFSGDDSYSIVQWVRDFEDIMTLYDVSEAKRWILAKQLLSGSAKTYIAHVAPLTWKDLRCELLQVFEKKVTSWDVCKQLEARKIAKGESALQYFVVMCGIAAQAEIATTDVIKFIVEGLQDQTGLAAAMLYCTSLSELRDQMMTYEKTRKVTAPVFGRNNEITKGRPSAKIVTSQNHNVNETRCYNCRRFGHVMKECTQPKRPDGACFGCWSTDHQYAQCPKRKMTTTIAAVQDDESLGETNEDELAAVQSIKL
ncbi:hypothetical protein ACLKA7_005112 [Drosophila subpalustris]